MPTISHSQLLRKTNVAKNQHDGVGRLPSAILRLAVAQEIPLGTFVERAWYALHCLPRGAKERPPSYKSLEASVDLHQAAFSTLFGGNSKGEPRGPKLKKFAKALAVSADWLLSGEGKAPVLTGPFRPLGATYEQLAAAPAPERFVELEDRYGDNRQFAAEFARRSGVPEEAIERVLGRELDADEHPSPDYWLAEMKSTAWDMRQGKLPGRAALPGEIPDSPARKRFQQAQEQAAAASAAQALAPEVAPTTKKVPQSGK